MQTVYPNFSASRPSPQKASPMKSARFTPGMNLYMYTPNEGFARNYDTPHDSAPYQHAEGWGGRSVQPSVGLVLSGKAPYKVLEVQKLCDRFGITAGGSDYENEEVDLHDVVVYVDGQPMNNKTNREVMSALRGPLLSDCEIVLERASTGALYTIMLKRHLQPDVVLSGSTQAQSEFGSTIRTFDVGAVTAGLNMLEARNSSRGSGGERADSETDAMLGPYIQRGEIESELRELRGAVDAIRHGEQKWEEVVDPKTGSVYYRDTVMGQVCVYVCVRVNMCVCA